MSKEIEWSELYGVGDVICCCDTCSTYERFEFEDNNPDYKCIQKELRKLGWMSLKIGETWHDFCCEQCRNTYIKEH